MPNVGGKKFPYTPGGMAAAAEAASGSRGGNGGMPMLDEETLSMGGVSNGAIPGINMSKEELTQKLMELGLDERTVALLITRLSGAAEAAGPDEGAPPEGM